MQWTARIGQVTTQQMLVSYQLLNANIQIDCDQFFENYGSGNIYSPTNPLLNITDRPYERMEIYEHILHEIKNADETKYNLMHKGTPFFFLSWLSFTIKDFEKAIFYMDSAISEDIRAFTTATNPNGWQSTPAGLFLLLDPTRQGVSARSIMNEINLEFQNQINLFNQASGATLTLAQFVNSFVIPNIQNNSYRTILSGLYVFIMEYNERAKMIRLKSNQGGSIEPFLTHLFKGCLIFESLLKDEFSNGNNNTLGSYLSQPDALIHLEIGQGTYNANTLYLRDKPNPSGYTFPDILRLLPTWTNEDYSERIIAITYGVRNTAGHDLSWPVTFDENTYFDIYQAIVQSIFWFIWKVKI